MTDFMSKWQQFQKKTKKEAIRQEKLEILNEISQQAADNIYDWMADKEITDYDFDDLFDGAMRVAVEMESSDDKNLADISYQLHHEGWRPHKEQTDVEVISQAMGGPSGEDFAIEKVKQKKRHLDTGEEYEVEEEVARLNLERRTTKVIPKGPKAGQTVEKVEKTSMSKAINKSKDIEPRLKEWWQKKQTFYTKEKNWRQVARAFSNAAYDSEPTGDMSVIMSRHPIDVLRMSDVANISSCHSEGSGYFQCAVAEAKGHGPIAYLVATKDLDYFLSGDDSESRRRNFEKGNAPHLNIENFDDKEVFADSRRNIKGIRAIQRVRLRKYEDVDSGVVFAAPESRTYGRKVPGFLTFVRDWAAEGQKKFFENWDSAPQFNSLIRYGGTYGDTKDGVTLNKFFERLGLDADYNEYLDVHHEGQEEEDSLWEEYEQRVEELTNYANNTLEHSSVYAEVEDVGGDEPYVMMSATYGVEFPDSMFEDEHPGFDDWQTTVQIKDTIESIIDDMNLYIHFEDMNINHWGSTVSFNFDIPRDDYGGTPDDLEQFIDWIEREYDGEHEDITEAVRKALVQHEYILPQPFDVKTAQLEGEEPEYENWDYDMESRSIIFKTMSYHNASKFKLAPVSTAPELRDLQEKYPIQDYDDRTAFSPSFYKSMTKELQKIEDAAQEYAHKQLTLPGVEMASADKILDLPLLTKRKSRTGKFEAILTISLPERFVASDKQMWLLLRMELDITPDATDAQIQAVSKFVEYVDKNMDDVMEAARRAIKPLTDETKAKRQLEAKIPTPKEISKHLKDMPLEDMLDFATGFVAAPLWNERVTRIEHWRGELKKSAQAALKDAEDMLDALPGSPRARAAESKKKTAAEIAKIADAPASNMIDMSNLLSRDQEVRTRWRRAGTEHNAAYQLDTLAIFVKDFIDIELSGVAWRVRERFMFAAGLQKNWYDVNTNQVVAIEDQDRHRLDPAHVMSTKPSIIKPPAWYTDVFKVIGLREHRLAVEPEDLLREAIKRAVRKRLQA